MDSVKGITICAEVILPLAVRGTFTYKVPESLKEKVIPGRLVIVAFGAKKQYSAIVKSVYARPDPGEEFKEMLDIAGESSVIDPLQLKFWAWISEYYMCNPGEVMKAALPAGFCLQSETIISVNPGFNDYKSLNRESLQLLNIIENRREVSVRKLPSHINDRNTIGLLNSLVTRHAVNTGQIIKSGYKPREETYIILSAKYTDKDLNDILDRLEKAPKQKEILSAYIRITGYCQGADLFPVKKSMLMKESGALSSSIGALISKGILVSAELEVSRLKDSAEQLIPLNKLSSPQQAALASMKSHMADRDVVLLHGVTSAGKTEIYIHLIEEQLKQNRQVLYLLPEISLTSSMIDRLRRHFGSTTGVYHSRFTDAEQVEIWNRVYNHERKDGYKLILGARSAMFLPFRNLGLVIVDEEHDGSYKQHDPAPRYHARDSAIILASLSGSKTILGSSTPSVESYTNAVAGKYGLVALNERFGSVNLPEIIIADTREAGKRKQMVSHFTPKLLRAIDNALANKEQVILFRNRRGYSQYLECLDCGWIPSCTQCSVNLTWHKELNRLVCHYCGSSSPIPVKCGNCGHISMTSRGFGTEKIEDEIKIVFPGVKVARVDQDTTRRRDSFRKLLDQFEAGKTDIIIGTQMISKGLDLDNVTVVGVLNADSLLNFPDFRAHERAYQLMSQVSGRAGRREKQGRVVIQTADPDNRIIRQVVDYDFTGMYRSQMEERKIFSYPPVCRLIRIVLKHRDKNKLDEFSSLLGNELKTVFGSRVLGPEYPLISRIKLWYLKGIMIKIEREKSMVKAKELMGQAVMKIEKMKGASALRISVDVDPY
jgi:primosomal protein N' (replication factor Y)